MPSAPLLKLIAAVLFFVLNTFHGWSAQQTTPLPSQPNAGEINSQSRVIWIAARNNNGTPPELSASDLEVKLDGKPASISDVHRLSPTLRYCLLLDVSGSTRDARRTQYDTAVALLSKIPRAGRDYGLLVSFNNQAYVDAEGTDPQKLIKGITQDARGSTAMYDAMFACSDRLSEKDSTTGARDTVRVMFVLSDGEDNSSRITREEAERKLVTECIRVYSIGQKDFGYAKQTQAARTGRARKTLQQFAEATGGKNYLQAKEVTLDQIVDDISSALGGLYVVTLASETMLPGDRIYKLEIRCRKRDLAVTAPREYFVPLR